MVNVIPKPVSEKPGSGYFTISADTKIILSSTTAELQFVSDNLAEHVNQVTGIKLTVASERDKPILGGIHLTMGANDPQLGEEGYDLMVNTDQINLRANKPAGLYYAVQTLRQLFPLEIERKGLLQQSWQIPAVLIRDYPRFSWRGAMLDVARHFFSVEDVKKYIDLLAFYKMNRFHMHLSDDQGWRIMIHSWPNLAEHGGKSAVGGGNGGFYTQEEYADLVNYAQNRFITLVPEIEMPSHTNAALASYLELNCDDHAPELYTGIEVGFCSLCVNKEITYQFVDDVIREVAALTPGTYFHIGGDEPHSTSKADYKTFIEKVQPVVAKYGKRMIGWEEIVQADLAPDTIVQQWFSDGAQKAVQRGNKVILSPAFKTYLDMKYDNDTTLGLNWAGNLSVQGSYDWDPVQLLDVPESAVLGIEAPLWSETLQTFSDIEYMAFPRLLGIAEIGWSPAAMRDWDEYKLRLAAQTASLEAMGVNFYRDAQVPWQH